MDKFKNKYRIPSSRLQTRDYGNYGSYFITYCPKNREHFFGKIVDGKMQLNDIAIIAAQFWKKIRIHFPFIKSQNFVMMPNHVHGILKIDKIKFLYQNILFFLCLVFILSCDKNEPDKLYQPITIGTFSTCNFIPAHDTTYIHNQLIGKWKWYYIRCYWMPEKANGNEFKGISVEFKPDNTLEVSQNGVVTQTSSWKIEDLHAGYYGIDTQPLMKLTPGIIAFCENELAFLDSYVDGCDNYFVR